MAVNGKILVIDDDRDLCEVVSAAAESLGWSAQTLSDATRFEDHYTPDLKLILLDLAMPGRDGVEVMRALSRLSCSASIVLMSGVNPSVQETAAKLASALGLRVAGQLRKPFGLEALTALLKRLSGGAPHAARRTDARIDFHDDELRRAIEKDQMELHYQPLIDIASGQMSGVEALVRWRHPDRGLIFPRDFLSRAETLGLIEELGWLTVDRGLSEVTLFANSSGVLPGLSLNITVHSLRDLSFPDLFTALARRHSVPARNLTLEITETGLLSELSSTLDVLARLRMRDVRLSIDDFGAGYSMMHQLRNVPATELKIDMSFVQNMQASTGDRVVVQKSIELGHDLGLQVVAEGVETEEQFEFLRTRGCDIAQGFRCSRPLPPAALQDWLRHRQPAYTH